MPASTANLNCLPFFSLIGPTDGTDASANLAAAIASGKSIALFPGTFRINSNVTIPSNLIPFGGVLQPASGVTITQTGAVSHAPKVPWYDTSLGGTVNVIGSKNIATYTEVNLVDNEYHPVPGNTADDTADLQALLNLVPDNSILRAPISVAGGGPYTLSITKVTWPNRTTTNFTGSGICLVGNENITIGGGGTFMPSPIIKLIGGASNDCGLAIGTLYATDDSKRRANCGIRGFVIEGNGQTYSDALIAVRAISGIDISHNYFRNSGACPLLSLRDAYEFYIYHNYFGPSNNGAGCGGIYMHEIWNNNANNNINNGHIYANDFESLRGVAIAAHPRSTLAQIDIFSNKFEFGVLSIGDQVMELDLAPEQSNSGSQIRVHHNTFTNMDASKKVATLVRIGGQSGSFDHNTMGACDAPISLAAASRSIAVFNNQQTNSVNSISVYVSGYQNPRIEVPIRDNASGYDAIQNQRYLGQWTNIEQSVFNSALGQLIYDPMAFNSSSRILAEGVFSAGQPIAQLPYSLLREASADQTLTVRARRTVSGTASLRLHINSVTSASDQSLTSSSTVSAVLICANAPAVPLDSLVRYGLYAYGKKALHSFLRGNSIIVSGAGQSYFNGTFPVAGVSGDYFWYLVNPGSSAYAYSEAATGSVSATLGTSITVVATHAMQPYDKFVIAGVTGANTALNGRWTAYTIIDASNLTTYVPATGISASPAGTITIEPHKWQNLSWVIPFDGSSQGGATHRFGNASTLGDNSSDRWRIEYGASTAGIIEINAWSLK